MTLQPNLGTWLETSEWWNRRQCINGAAARVTSALHEGAVMGRHRRDGAGVKGAHGRPKRRRTGLSLVVNGASAVTPFSRTVIVGSNNSISAPSPQTLNGTSYQFVSWSDQGAATHNITAGATASTYTATYQAVPQTPVHVGDLDATKSALNKNFWRTTVTVLVHDANEAPISGATVSGSWSGGATGNASCTTGASGTCSVSVAKIASSQPNATFTVTNVASAGRTYAASANHDPETDSNGTSITITKP